MEANKDQKVTKIYLATQSEVKISALRSITEQYKFFKDAEIVPYDIQPESNPAQPVNSGLKCARRRLEALKEQILSGDGSVEINEKSNVFLALESEISTEQENHPVDVCHVVATRGEVEFTSFSYSIDVPDEYFKKTEETAEKTEDGFNVTVGETIEAELGINAKNWMKDEKFGGFDRVEQLRGVLESVLGKILVESKIAYYNDFPKEGVIFKDLSLALADPECLVALVNKFLSCFQFLACFWFWPI